MSKRAELVGMLVIKRELIDKDSDPERLTRWIAQAVEVLLDCELSRIDDATKPEAKP